jgi:hypothetical protein
MRCSLQAAINRYFDERNAQPARFVWPLQPARAVAAYAGAMGGAATVNWLDSFALVMCSCYRALLRSFGSIIAEGGPEPGEIFNSMITRGRASRLW